MAGEFQSQGHLPTQPGRLWAGRKQPPEVKGTRQTRVPGNELDLGPFLPASPVPLTAGHTPILSASSRGAGKAEWEPRGWPLKPGRSPTSPKPHCVQGERQDKVPGILSSLPQMGLRLGPGTEKELSKCVLVGDTAGVVSELLAGGEETWS